VPAVTHAQHINSTRNETQKTNKNGNWNR